MLRFEGIDRLRGLAILMVVWHHLRWTLLAPLNIPYFLSHTWSGVDLFFVISGFVVTRSFFTVASGEDGGPQPFSNLTIWKTFVKRRYTRILPVSWIWALIPLGLTLLPSGKGEFGEFREVWQEVLGVVTLSYNYLSVYFFKEDQLGIFWSLTIEEHFYLLLPLVLAFFNRKIIKPFLCIATISVILARLNYVYLNVDAGAEVHVLSHFRFDSLLVGVLLFIFNDFFKKINFKKVNSLLVKALSWVCVIFLITLPAVLPTRAMLYFGFDILALTSGALVLLASLDKKYIFEIPFLNYVMNFIGKRSYSLYLVHTPCIWIILELGDRSQKLNLSTQGLAITGTLCYFLLVFFVTQMTFIFIEEPTVARAKLITLKSRTADHFSNQAA